MILELFNQFQQARVRPIHIQKAYDEFFPSILNTYAHEGNFRDNMQILARIIAKRCSVSYKPDKSMWSGISFRSEQARNNIMLHIQKHIKDVREHEEKYGKKDTFAELHASVAYTPLKPDKPPVNIKLVIKQCEPLDCRLEEMFGME